ncbi:hypothetical protein HPHPA16_0687 [Helicobacter pylori Hp A-16]|nr:hypothetical protein HPHPA16_0687 [Helicobacter pylori Hp A-16]EMH07696.1 hypothetical protein HMPREF1410_01470 [Helicobacter pylori GAM249T]
MLLSYFLNFMINTLLNQYPIRIKPKSKENQFFQPLFLRTRYFFLILNF